MSPRTVLHLLWFRLLAASATLDRHSLLQSHVAISSGGGDEAEFTRFEHGEGPRVHLVSFRSCSQNRYKICNRIFFSQLSQLSGMVKHIPSISFHHLFQGLPPELENDTRWRRHVVEGVRGRGYWFWKPALLNAMLSNDTIRDGDVVVWADGDVEKHPKYFKIPEAWPAFLAQNKKDLVVQRQNTCEGQWTKGDIFKRFNVSWTDQHYGLSPQVHAQFFVLRVNERTRKLLRYWEDLMTDYHLVSDEKSNSTNPPYFKENRHDQSILSMLVKASSQEKLPFMEDCSAYTKKLQLAGKITDGGTYTRGLHPEFGIPNFSAEVVDFRQLLNTSLQRERDEETKKSLAGMQKAVSLLMKARRRVCITGKCYNLDTLNDRTPKEVEAEGGEGMA